MTSLTTLLFGSLDAARRQLDVVLGPGGLDLGHITVGDRAIQPPQVSSTLIDLLDMPLGNIAAEGWNGALEVRRARQRTAASPGSREVVTLGHHSVTSRQSPTVDASYGPARVTVLRLDVKVTIEMAAVRLVVEGGYVVDSLADRPKASATVSAGRVTLAHCDLTPVDLGTASEAPRRAAAPV